MLLNPAARISSNVAGTTGGLFQEPSFGTASRVFPRFQPGFKPANAADAETGVKAAVHELAAVVEAAALLVEEALLLEEEILLLVNVEALLVEEALLLDDDVLLLVAAMLLLVTEVTVVKH